MFFPDECRLCGRAFSKITAYPVCDNCINKAKPLSAEHFCVLCRTPFGDAHSLDDSGRCALCLEGTRGFDAAYSYGAYDGELRDLVHLFKYARIRSLDRPLGRMISSALPRDEDFDCIVPVPMHWRRRWERGFNQADCLARVVARRSGRPLSNALRRTRRTPAQAGLTEPQRRENLVGAFRASSKNKLKARRILLVDDVFTTGATASACARILKEAGARSVTLLTLARVDRRWAELPAGGNLSGDS